MSEAELARAGESARRVADNVATVMRGQQRAVRLLLAGFLSGGHVLLEDVPGTGKTTLAKALAGSFSCDFKRVQATPDLLPSDILGVSIFDQRNGAFQFRAGPVFTHILLCDEINRASPRTQSALLEAMAEGQVSVEGERRPLEEPFFVMATQNPVEFHGTYPLPEAQMDRFALRFGLGYVSAEEEVAILAGQERVHPLSGLKPCADVAEARRLRQASSAVRVGEALRHYVVALVRATREAEGVKLGASPRAAIALLKGAQALTLLDGGAFITPEAVVELAEPVLAHRLVLHHDARFSGASAAEVVRHLLERVPLPA